VVLSQDKLKDKLGVKSTKAALLVQLGRLSDAQVLYRQLLDLNPDDYSVHEGLHRWAVSTGWHRWRGGQREAQQAWSCSRGGPLQAPVCKH
jgi:hypothetical protein